jgi:hypothetical protein
MVRIPANDNFFQRDKQMNTFYGTAVLGAITTLVSLSGCIVARDHGPYDRGPYNQGTYRYENGDRIDRDGRREAHWCDNHRDDDEHCRR